MKCGVWDAREEMGSHGSLRKGKGHRKGTGSQGRSGFRGRGGSVGEE